MEEGPVSEWTRVTREDRCPICQKDSWCTYNSDVVICMRVQGGREKVFKDGSIGWVYRSGGTKAAPVNPPHRSKPEVAINSKAIMASLPNNLEFLNPFAKLLGVDSSALAALGCRWSPSHKAYAFPMFDGYGNTVGIRLRSHDGRKWAVKGSRQGIFVPANHPMRRAFVLEGPTDTAAALTMGVYAVGRPHCAGGMEDIKHLFKRCGVREAVIVADNDDPGIRGAIMLRDQLRIPTAILMLPCKDMRKFLNQGGTVADINDRLSNVTWHQPTSH